MGCRCCKMIKSYIFEPEEIQSPRHTNETNSYKSDKQESSKSKGNQNSETPVHENELQSEELKRTENKNRYNSTREAYSNHKPALHKEGLGNCVEKSNSAHDDVSSCSGTHPLNPNTNQIKETTPCGNFSQSASSSFTYRTGDLCANGLSQTYEYAKECDPETDDHKKLGSEEPESSRDESSQSAENSSLTESAILDTHNDAIQLPDTDHHPHSNQIINCNALEKDSFSDNYTHSDQTSATIAINQGEDPSLGLPLHKKETFGSLDKALKTESVNVYVKEAIPDWTAPTALIAEDVKHINHKDTNGNTEEEEEEEDAEVAEALAALEAATAGEDYEEDDEY
ncbi:PDCD10 and GCKIII kinases-associated protein 1 [Carettochelys insculpta]|uniref:PDCD10 and GCKIII kinases-associated protein 1 n=1 Tax=Carettochelys insculpta TaxID=44489 RepID=UPI003EBE6506